MHKNFPLVTLTCSFNLHDIFNLHNIYVHFFLFWGDTLFREIQPNLVISKYVGLVKKKLWDIQLFEILMVNYLKYKWFGFTNNFDISIGARDTEIQLYIFLTLSTVLKVDLTGIEPRLYSYIFSQIQPKNVILYLQSCKEIEMLVLFFFITRYEFLKFYNHIQVSYKCKKLIYFL